MPRSEPYQLGFRLVDIYGLSHIHAANTWRKNYDKLEAGIRSEQRAQASGIYYKNNPDTHLRYTPPARIQSRRDRG